MMDDARLLALAARVLRIEADAVLGLIPRLDERFARGGRPAARVRGARDRDRHGEVGPRRAEDRRRRSRAPGRRPTSSIPPRAFTGTSACWRAATSCWPCRIPGRRTRCSRCCRRSSGSGSPLVLLTGTPGSTLGAAGRRGAGRGRQRGGLPHESGADVEHDRGAGHGRCARHGAARPARPPPGGLRRAPPAGSARLEVAVPGPRPDAHGREPARRLRARDHEGGHRGDERQAPRHDDGGGRRGPAGGPHHGRRPPPPATGPRVAARPAGPGTA